MKDVVLKPFNSTSRRFAEGDPISEADDVAPRVYADLKKRHFVGAPKSDAPVATKAKPAKR